MVKYNALFFLLVYFAFTMNSCNSSSPEKSLKGSDFDKGKEVYARTCTACHLADGKGIAGTFPPLAHSDFLIHSKTDAITQVIKGKTGSMIVNGMPYDNIMPPQQLNDEEIAHVLTYVYASFGNNGTKVTTEEVKSVRTGMK